MINFINTETMRAYLVKITGDIKTLEARIPWEPRGLFRGAMVVHKSYLQHQVKELEWQLNPKKQKR